MMPRVAKQMMTRRSLNAAAGTTSSITVASSPRSKEAQKSIKAEDYKQVKASSKKLTPSLSRDFERNICKTEKHDVSSCEYTSVIGCDEAGRGPLCGPVVAAAVWVTGDVVIEHGINDSKATTEAQREETFEILVNHPGVKYAVVRIEHDEIDEINILQASLKAMRLACTKVLEQLSRGAKASAAVDPKACICLVDGNKCPPDMPIHTKCIIKGDSQAFSIAAASIIAKISRDRIMTAYAEEYPLYGLAQHKGYPTLAHRTLLSKHGPSPIHRMSYRPVYESVKGYVKPTDSEKKKKSKAVKVVNTSTSKGGKSKGEGKRSRSRTVDGCDEADDTPSNAVTTTATSGRVTRSSTRKRKEMHAIEEGDSGAVENSTINGTKSSNKRAKVKATKKKK